MDANIPPKPVFELEPWNRGLTDEELLSDLRRVADERGRDTVTYSEYDAYGRCRSRTIEVRLGGWNSALKRAGLKVERRVGLTREELFENLEEVWSRLGRQPREREMVRPLSRISKGTYSRHFGTWRKALEAFIQWVNVEGQDESHGKESINIPKRPLPSPRQPSLRLRFKVMSRDRFSCRHCGKSPAHDPNVILHVDHVIPWSAGGETSLENLQTLCQSCNLGKSNLNESKNG